MKIELITYRKENFSDERKVAYIYDKPTEKRELDAYNIPKDITDLFKNCHVEYRCERVHDTLKQTLVYNFSTKQVGKTIDTIIKRCYNNSAVIE